MNPAKMKGVRRAKAPDTLLVEAALEHTGVPTQVADLRALTGLPRARLGAIIANLRQRGDVSYITGEGYVMGQAPRVSLPGVVEPCRDSVQTRGTLLYAGMGAPVRPGASDHERIPSRVGDALVYSNK